MSSSSSAVNHWKYQRLSAIALIPLTIWFIISIASLADANYVSVLNWLQTPLTTALLSLFVIVSCYHAVLGIEVVVEDYIQEPTRHRLFNLIRIVLLAAALLSLLVIIKISVENP